jgi:hypothetical protein
VREALVSQIRPLGHGRATIPMKDSFQPLPKAAGIFSISPEGITRALET